MIINQQARVYAILIALCAGAALGSVFQPKHLADPPPEHLSDLIPRTFGDWHAIDQGPAAINPKLDRAGAEPSIDNPYDDILMRNYANGNGAIVQLALAYGHRQQQEVKIHRPDLCYTAQGFEIRSVSYARLTDMGRTAQIDGSHMLASAPGRTEAVTYWIRIGNTYPRTSWAIRYQILKEGLKGNVDDGMLVRASEVLEGSNSDVTKSYALQASFLRSLVEALPPETRRLLSVQGEI